MQHLKDGKNRLRAWRLRNGYSVQEVADILGISASQLSRLERGKRRAGLEQRIQFARCLGVRVAALFDAEVPP